jgi:uncharacterized protein YndB with AHSA1/START domain
MRSFEQFAVASLTVWALPCMATSLQLPPALASPPNVASQVDVDHIRSRYSSEDWRALQDGKIVSSEVRESGAGEASTAQAAGIIRYPPKDVWTVLTDFPSRPRYHPSTKEARIVRVDGNRVWVAEHLKFLWVNVRFHVIDTLNPELGTVSWVMDENAAHDIRDTKGFWQLAPLAQGQHTLVTYRAWLDTGKPVPGFIETFMLNRSLPQMISGIRAEVDRRFGGNDRHD